VHFAHSIQYMGILRPHYEGGGHIAPAPERAGSNLVSNGQKESFYRKLISVTVFQNPNWSGSSVTNTQGSRQEEKIDENKLREMRNKKFGGIGDVRGDNM
jgi:hypothetical protein